ncbi:MAG: glycosyltransferase [Bacteroidota bacterium]|nr:glycosyltransferase [Bacteroidota bacterium]
MKDIPGKESDVLVSIIIATFNAEKHLPECLESIASQSEKSIEIIIVDGGSKDGTPLIIREFEKENLIWLSEPDTGIYDALNKGIGMANGKWLYFMGADDRLLPGFSEMAYKLKDRKTIYYGDSQPFYFENKKPVYELLVGKFTNYRLAKYPMNHQAILYPSKVFEKYQYNLSYKVFADYALNIQLWGNNSFKKKYYPIKIARYDMNGFSSTMIDVPFKNDKPKLIRKYLGWLVYLRFILKRHKKRLRGETGFE